MKIKQAKKTTDKETEGRNPGKDRERIAEDKDKPDINEDKKKKNDRLRNAIDKFQLDIIGLQEPNKDWYLIEEQHRWPQRTKEWWEARHTSVAFNTYDIGRQKFQPGGNIVTSINKVAHRANERERDDTNLGRWASTLYKGKNNVKLRVVSAYRTCKIGVAGVSTAHRQQERYLNDQKIEATPREAFLEDLGQTIDEWRNQGEQIVLLTDLNTDVRSNEIKTWATAHGIEETLTKDDQEIIATNSRGSASIDGIFVSPSISVVRKGYSEFGAFPTDHRLLWIDITYVNAFGHNMPPIHIPGARRLKTDDVDVTNKWNKVYRESIQNKKLHTTVYKIEKACNKLKEGEELPHQLQKQFDKVLEQREKLRKIADKKCRKLRMNNNACSPELNEVKKTIRLYEGAITRRRGAKFSLKLIKRLERRTKIYNTHLLSTTDLNIRLETTIKKLKKLTKKAQEIRTTYLTRKAEAKARENDLDAAKVLTQMRDRELIRSSHRKISYVRGKTDRGSLTKVEIHTEGGVQELTEKETIEQECMNENDKKYHQTEDTPCMKEPLRSMLGNVAQTDFAESILRGEFETPPGTDQYVNELFKELKQADIPAEELPKPSITSENFTQGWKKMKESTSAGISGTHFGHLKAAAKDKFLASFESSVTHIPYRSGISPEKWCVGLDVMIQKKGGSLAVHKLRTIVLLEAEFNFNNKILGRTAIRHAEKYNLLADEQYGSRPGRCAIEHAVHKRLWYDIMRQKKSPGIMISNDAKSNYDRIIHSIASLAYKRIGMPHPPVHSMLETIQKMQHYIRTSYGDSLTFMDSRGTLIPYQGMLQGNGASPTTWVLISTPLINMLRTAGNGTHLRSAITKETSHIVAFAFVDDTDIPIANLLEDINIEVVRDQAQEAITRWEGGLKATGGAVVPDKSFAYVIDYDFNEKGDWRYKKRAEMNVEIRVKDHTDEVQQLEIREHNYGSETLGVFLAPDGNNDHQIEEMQKKTKKWAEDIKTGHLNGQDAWRAIETTLFSSLKYPVPALTLTRRECTTIMDPAITAGLNAINISRKFPRDLVYGSKKEKGLGFTDIYHEQGITQCVSIFKHLNSNSMTGKFLRCSLEAGMIEMGISGNLFTYNYRRYHKLMSDTLLKSTWKYAHEENITIDQYITPELPVLRENDSFLIEDAINSGLFRPRELEVFNNCRKYLQVTRLSEILDGFGAAFNKTFWGEKEEFNFNKFDFPRQGQLSQDSLRIWRRMLRKLYLNQNRHINRQLGNWYGDQISDWKWYIQKEYPFHLYEKRRNRIRMYKRSSRRGQVALRPTYKYHVNTLNLPNGLWLATVEKIDNNTITITGRAPITNEIQELRTVSIWGDKELLEFAEVPKEETITKIIRAIAAGTLKIVSDGSYFEKHKIGAAAWFIDDGKEILLRGKGRVPGISSIQSSYRSELYGMLGGLLHLLHSLKQTTDIQGKITFGCDGKGALLAILHKYALTDPTRKNADIIDSIWKMMDSRELDWEFEHIDSHQDDLADFEDLSRSAQLNVMADEAAKEHCRQYIDNNDMDPIFPWLPFQKIQLMINGQPISGEIRKTLHEEVAVKRARRHWKQRHMLNNEEFNGIDWELAKRSTNNYPKSKWISKWCSGFCGVGTQLVRYGQQNFDHCPRCQEPGENVRHVLLCSCETAKAIWNNKLDEMEEWMRKERFNPYITVNIVGYFRQWHTGGDFTVDSWTPAVRHALDKQHAVGWQPFLEGFMVEEWRTIQTTFMIQEKDKRSSLKLLSNWQRKWWEIMYLQWEDRNRILHEQEGNTHKQEIKDLDEEINTEWLLNTLDLPERYQSLFSGTLEDLISLPYWKKYQWLASVWLARQHHNGFHALNGTNKAVKMFKRWRKQQERRELRNH